MCHPAGRSVTGDIVTHPDARTRYVQQEDSLCGILSGEKTQRQHVRASLPISESPKPSNNPSINFLPHFLAPVRETLVFAQRLAGAPATRVDELLNELGLSVWYVTPRRAPPRRRATPRHAPPRPATPRPAPPRRTVTDHTCIPAPPHRRPAPTHTLAPSSSKESAVDRSGASPSASN